MKFRRASRRSVRENIELNLTSLIDVVFILLLFFVVTATFTHETQLRVELPEAVSGTPPEDASIKPLEISINADGQYSVNDQLLLKNDLPTLMNVLQKESGGDNTLPLTLSADGKTPHQAVVTAMDAAGKLGFAKLRITTIEARTAP